MNFITVFLLFNFGGGEIFLILVAAIMMFGSKRIPEIARGLGKGIREVRNATDDIKREIQKGINETESQIHEATRQAEKPAEELNEIAGAVTRKKPQPKPVVDEENVSEHNQGKTPNQYPE